MARYIAARELDATIAKLRDEKTKIEVELKELKDKKKADETAETTKTAESTKLRNAVLWLVIGVVATLVAFTCSSGMRTVDY